MWFGQSYDPATFALTGRSTTFRIGTAVAFIAALSRPTRDETLLIVAQSPAGPYNAGSGKMTAGNNLLGFLLQPVYVGLAGPYTMTVTDGGGNVLATGSFTMQ
jgi:hypothetical protein